MRQSDHHDIIAIGGSYGSTTSFSALLKELPAQLPAAVFCVQHLSNSSPSRLAAILGAGSSLEVKIAEDGEKIRNGMVYVCVPDKHLLVLGDHIRVYHGPRENRWRPSVDSLFRSAAVTCGPRVIAVVLSGYLDDGSVGLSAVKRCGGVAIVQDPSESLAPSMPEHALRGTRVDYCLPLPKISETIVRLVQTPVNDIPEVPEELRAELKIMAPPDELRSLPPSVGNSVPLTCPECGGPLLEIDDSDEQSHFRCLVGHAFSNGALTIEQDSQFERAIWAAARMMEERSNLMRLNGERERKNGLERSAKVYEERAAEARKNATILKQLLFESPRANERALSGERQNH